MRHGKLATAWATRRLAVHRYHAQSARGGLDGPSEDSGYVRSRAVLNGVTVRDLDEPPAYEQLDNITRQRKVRDKMKQVLANGKLQRGF